MSARPRAAWARPGAWTLHPRDLPGLGPGRVLSTRRSLPWSPRLPHGCGQLPCPRRSGSPARSGGSVPRIQPLREALGSTPLSDPSLPRADSRVPRAVPGSEPLVQGLGGSGLGTETGGCSESLAQNPAWGVRCTEGIDGFQQDRLLLAGMEHSFQQAQRGDPDVAGSWAQCIPYLTTELLFHDIS